MMAIDLSPHEFAANLIFDEYGLQPFFACDSVVKQNDGSARTEFHHNGETWVATLYYQDSGILPPGQQTPQGTDWSLDEMREFRIAIFRHPHEDEVGEQKFNAHIAPRWQGMKVENDEGEQSELSVPECITEGINVRVKGSNIKFNRYHELLSRALQALDINRRYVRSPHEVSNAFDAEMYCRLYKDRSGPIHARDGPIASLGHLLESDRDGYRAIKQNDRDEKGRHRPGYYHTVTLGTGRIQEAWPSHRLPKEIKHYYAREAVSKPDSDPLAHPKLGASYQVSAWDEKIGVTDAELDELEKELSETVLSVLAEAGIPIRPGEDGNGPFKPDAYFDAEESNQDLNLVSLDLTQIRSEQESVVIKHLADGLSPVEWEALETLVTDGGEVSPQDIAEDHGRHVDSVRRALNRIPELVESEYGSVALRSNHIAEHVHEAVKQAQDATKRALEAGAKAIEAAERGLDETTSAFIAWAARMGIDVDDRKDAQLVLRMGNMSKRETKRAIREAYELWCDAGKDPARFRQADLRFGEGGTGTAWHWL